jgi:O-antigen/teichoic acid export membrane protein
MSTTIVNSALGFVFWIVAARLFTAQVVGLTAAIVGASTIVVLLASLGVGGTLIQSLPEQGKSAGWSRTFWAGMAVAVATSLAIGCAALVLLPVIIGQLAPLHSARYATVFAVGTVGLTAGTIFDYVFVAERAAGGMFGRNSILATSKVLIVVLLTLVAGTSAMSLLGAWAAASVVGLGFGIVLLTRRVNLLRPPRASVLTRTALGLRSRLAGHQLIGMGGALLPYLLPLLVTARLSSSDNAYFYTTWMMAGIFLIIAPAMSQSLFAEGAHSPHDLLVKARSALATIGIILAPCVVGVFVMGGILLSAFGPAYENHAIGLLRIVLLASIPDAVTNVYIAMLRVRRRLVAAAALNLGMGIGIVALSWALLPVLGISAVGWAFLAMQLCGCVFVALDLLRSSTRVRAVEGAPIRSLLP